MVTCNNCFHCCMCPIADGVEYADEQHIRDECEYFVDTAEVVPKSEVDKTIAEWAYLHADVLNKLEKAKADVAREIFEEIEKTIRKHDERPKYNLMLDLAKLKNKYTEAVQNESHNTSRI